MATYNVKSGGKEYQVTVVDHATGGASVTIEDETFEVEFVGGAPAAGGPAQVAPTVVANPGLNPAPLPLQAAAPVAAGSGSITAPIPGQIVSILVKVGDSVEAGQVVLKLEAMKMENDLAAPASGVVEEIAVSEGADVSGGQLLMVIG